MDEYGSTENGELAKLMLANSYFNLRDFEKAEKYYKDYSGGNTLLQVSSAAGLASVFEAKNNFLMLLNNLRKLQILTRKILLLISICFMQVRII